MSTAKAQKPETRQFQAETKELLDLMINSIYTHKEIFLRELISNASDALDKIRFRSITEPELVSEGENFAIRIELDEAAQTISVSDNGIGMTYDEVVENIGTIAKSGTRAFLEKLKQQKKEGSDLDKSDFIGQFGVGFYSAFTAGDTVTVLTRAAGADEGVRWESSADGSYTIERYDKPERGTTVIVKLKEEKDEDEPNFTNEYTVKNLVKKYSDYIRYPIQMEVTQPQDPEAKEKSEPKKALETLNSMVPLWVRPKSDIKDEEYHEFYKTHFHDWADPDDVLHIKAEGVLEYTALIFIPSKAPFDFYSAEYEKGLQLYAKHVFVMDKCKELVPDYLRFVRGLVDSADFSLNISREILQHTRHLRTIGKNIEKKVLDALATMLKDEREKYGAWWKEFGDSIKSGIYTDRLNKEKLQDLLLFPSSHSEEGMTTLAEYVSRMPEGQKEIYFATGKDRTSIESLPQMEMIREKGYEVLYFMEKADEFITLNLNEYDGKNLKSVSRGDLDLDEGKSEEEKKEEVEQAQEAHKDFLKALEEDLKGRVKEVRVSKRLKSSAVCLVGGDAGLSFNMEQVIQATGAQQMMPKAEKILEVNPEHALFKTLESEFEAHGNSDALKNYAELLYSQALLIEGYTLDDPADFSNRMSELMVKALS